MENEKKVETPKTNKEVFVEKLEAITKETGCSLLAYPRFVPRDDGSFSVVIAYEVAEAKKEKDN
jgi:hypothetical protein